MQLNDKRNDHYIVEEKYVKDYYIMVKKAIESDKADFKSMIDVGCATGDFIDYIINEFGSNRKYYGMDSNDSFLEIANRRVDQAIFFNGNIVTGKGLENRKADIVCMLGVLDSLSTFSEAFENLISMTSENGNIYILSGFNKNGVHVEYKFNYGSINSTYYGYSVDEISQWLDDREYEYEFIPFNIKTEIKKSEDPLRAYTIPLRDGSLGIVNGINMWQEFSLLRIKL